MMKTTVRRLAVRVTLLLPLLVPLSVSARSKPAAAVALPLPSGVEVPEPLKPWTQWVLQDHESALCPFLEGDEGDEGKCAWPARLGLVLDGKGGRFTQTWRVYHKQQVSLPGDGERWPQDVLVDGKPAIVVPDEDGAVPSVLLGSGDHTITGAFFWDELPESVHVPQATGLVALTLQGKAVPLPARDADGKVWLQKQAAPKVEADVLDVTVHRRVMDEIPLVLITRIELRVAGKNREVVLGKALPDGFVPMSLDSPVPARVEPDSRLRAQVRPGTYVLTLTARHAAPAGPAPSLSRPKPEGPWTTGDEVWVFDARPALRLVNIEGVNAIDPQQTTLPDDWKRLPAYPMALDSSFKLVEQRRGDADPAPDQLQLSRELWLDFDGKGYTVTDRLSGTLHRAWRLEVSPPTQLGRVSVGGKDQFITRVAQADKSERAGVEIRQGRVDVSADSRLVGNVGDVPAVSWDADFQHVEGVLHLPPGWRLFHASGADEVPGTWIRRWTLLDIFLVLIIAMAVGRLFGLPWGGLALVTLVLVFPENDSPRWAWLALLGVEALLRVLPRGRLEQLLRVVRVAAGAGLVLLVLAFAVGHVRSAIYPSLERDVSASGSYDARPELSLSNKTVALMPEPAEAPMPSGVAGGVPMGGAGAAPSTGENLANEAGNGDATRHGAAGKKGRALKELEQLALDGKVDDADAQQRVDWSSNGYLAKSAKIQQAAQYDNNSVVQTGPGLPRWTWRQLSLRWSGPVERAQRLRLFLVPPWFNLVLAGLRVLLLLVVVFRLLDPPSRYLPGVLRRGFPPTGTAALLALLAILGAARPARADLPNKELLDQLRERLLKKPECRPHCASSPRLALDVQPRLLRARMEVDAAAPTAVLLPGRGDQWVPEQVSLDGKPAQGLLRGDDGKLWIQVGEGSHLVLLEGRLPARDTVQIALPFKSHRVEARVEGWQLDGLHEDGIADDDLQLTRIRGGAREETDSATSLQPGALPPFVRVVRELHFGLQWEMDTHVVRATPTGSAVVLEVPLLPGESVTTAEVRVVAGKALINMAPAATSTSWHSLLAQQPVVKLQAPKGLPWVEEWRLDVSPIWHVAIDGIPQVHQQDDNGLRLPFWQPWPGEAVTITAGRPEGVGGQTLTVDHSALTLTPGLRATDATLALDVRSSRGGQHALTLPDGAVLQSVSIDGKTQPIRQDKRKVTVPLVPGAQRLSLSWRQPEALGLHYRTPEVDLGAPSVNAEVIVMPPADRWVLLMGGPRLGPAVLFWSMVLVLIWVAIALGQVKWTPLGVEQWLLLGLGLSQVPLPLAAVVAGWLLLLGWRDQHPEMQGHTAFNLRQLFLVAWSLVALGILVSAIYDGLLGQPDMQIQGNDSSGAQLRWFQDRCDGSLPQAWVLSVPLMVYRVAMLLWALWIARALLTWLKWGWGALSRGGIWRRPPVQPIVMAPSAPPDSPPAPPAAPASPNLPPPPPMPSSRSPM